MARYAVDGSQNITATPFDSCLSIVSDSTTQRRGKLIEFTWGARANATAADVIIDMTVGRITAAGIAGSAVTPKQLDPADAVALADVGENHSTEPTYTANEELFDVGRHMRATYRWVAAPGAEFVYPATSANGFGFFPGHASAATEEIVTAIFQEE